MQYVDNESFLINGKSKEIVPSRKMSQYSPGELRQYFDREIEILTLENEEGYIFTTFEVDNFNMEGMELNLPLYCGDKTSYIENYMAFNILVSGSIEESVLDLCLEQSNNILLQRATKVVEEYPEKIISSINETESFNVMTLHKAIMESNAEYEKCLDYYMDDYSIFEIEETSSPYIKNQNSFYEKLEKEAINTTYQNGKYTYKMYSGDLKYIMISHLNYEKTMTDINSNQKDVKIGNIEFFLVNIEIMLNGFLNSLDPKKNPITKEEENVLKELNYILDDIIG